VAEAWAGRTAGCVPPAATGIYLGIDGVNMPDGKGIELGCSTTRQPGSPGIDFIYDCDSYCDDLPMQSLAQFYDWFHNDEGYDTFGDADSLDLEYTVCFGASALVLREALRSLPAGQLVGSAGERVFAYGFHG